MKISKLSAVIALALTTLSSFGSASPDLSFEMTESLRRMGLTDDSFAKLSYKQDCPVVIDDGFKTNPHGEYVTQNLKFVNSLCTVHKTETNIYKAFDTKALVVNLSSRDATFNLIGVCNLLLLYPDTVCVIAIGNEVHKTEQWDLSGIFNDLFQKTKDRIIFVGASRSDGDHEILAEYSCEPYRIKGLDGFNKQVIIAPGYFCGHTCTRMGCSYAAPKISGAIALLVSSFKILPKEALEILLKTATRSAEQSMDIYGRGFVDLSKAVEMASTYKSTSPLLGPQATITYENYLKLYYSYLTKSYRHPVSLTILASKMPSDKKIACLKNAASKGYKNAINSLAAEAKKRTPLALQALKDIGIHGNVYAQCVLGKYYKRRKNFTLMLKWYALAAKQNSPTALLSLGKVYFNGTGVEKDLTKAQAYLEQAQQYDYTQATYNLGLLANHLGKTEEAKNLFKLVAEKGYIPAAEKLALINDENVNKISE